MCEWIISLIASRDLWITMLSSVIGGLVAFFIAKYQVTKSQEESEKVREEDNKRYKIEQNQLIERDRRENEESQKRIITFVEETAMRARDIELIKMQIKECDDSIAFLTKIPIILGEIGMRLNNNEDSQELGELGFDLFVASDKLFIASKIVGMDESVTSICGDICNIVHSMLIGGENKIVNKSVFIKEGRNISTYTGSLARSFTNRREALITELRK